MIEIVSRTSADKWRSGIALGLSRLHGDADECSPVVNDRNYRTDMAPRVRPELEPTRRRPLFSLAYVRASRPVIPVREPSASTISRSVTLLSRVGYSRSVGGLTCVATNCATVNGRLRIAQTLWTPPLPRINTA